MTNIVLNPDLPYGFKDVRGELVGDGFDWDFERATTSVEYVVIHHSAGPKDQTVEEIARHHVEERGWGGIGYHFVITPDGLAHYVGDIGMARANVLGKNEKVIGVCLTGDFTKGLPSDEQIIAAHELCYFLLFDLAPQFPGLGSWDQLAAHAELQATRCPGDNWDGAGGLKDRIIKRLPYGNQSDCQKEIDKLNQQIIMMDQKISEQEEIISVQNSQLIEYKKAIKQINDITLQLI